MVLTVLSLTRSEFEGLLEKSPSEANTFLADPDKYVTEIKKNPDAAAREQVEKVVDLLVTNRWGEGLRGGAVFIDCFAQDSSPQLDHAHVVSFPCPQYPCPAG